VSLPDLPRGEEVSPPFHPLPDETNSIFNIYNDNSKEEVDAARSLKLTDSELPHDLGSGTGPAPGFGLAGPAPEFGLVDSAPGFGLVDSAPGFGLEGPEQAVGGAGPPGHAQPEDGLGHLEPEAETRQPEPEGGAGQQGAELGHPVRLLGRADRLANMKETRPAWDQEEFPQVIKGIIFYSKENEEPNANVVMYAFNYGVGWFQVGGGLHRVKFLTYFAVP
jgi:hypothetical protein